MPKEGLHKWHHSPSFALTYEDMRREWIMIIFCDGFDWESYLGLHLSELIYNKKKKKYHISLNVLLDMKIKSIKKKKKKKILRDYLVWKIWLRLETNFHRQNFVILVLDCYFLVYFCASSGYFYIFLSTFTRYYLSLSYFSKSNCVGAMYFILWCNNHC